MKNGVYSLFLDNNHDTYFFCLEWNPAVGWYHYGRCDHLVRMILGRVYLYRRHFPKNRGYINRPLRLYSNEADNLVQLATCLAILGRSEEGQRLFSKGLHLYPYGNLRLPAIPLLHQ